MVMRGVKSIEQSSNALYVIDGVPMYNFGGGGDKEFGSRGMTESIADLNHDDIESVRRPERQRRRCTEATRPTEPS